MCGGERRGDSQFLDGGCPESSRSMFALSRACFTQVLVDNDKFLTELTKMYQTARSKGTVSFTLKRGMPREALCAPTLPVLISRAHSACERRPREAVPLFDSRAVKRRRKT